MKTIKAFLYVISFSFVNMFGMIDNSSEPEVGINIITSKSTGSLPVPAIEGSEYYRALSPVFLCEEQKKRMKKFAAKQEKLREKESHSEQLDPLGFYD